MKKPSFTMISSALAGLGAILAVIIPVGVYVTRYKLLWGFIVAGMICWLLFFILITVRNQLDSAEPKPSKPAPPRSSRLARHDQDAVPADSNVSELHRRRNRR